MPTLATSQQESTLAADEEFLAIVCSDEDLLRAEFDAIVAAEWPSPPPVEPDLGADAGRRLRRVRHRSQAASAVPPSRPRHPGIGGWTRQRSPPSRGSDNRRQERS